MEQKIMYTEPLTGTMAEAAEVDELGTPYSPLKQMWQVNPGSEAIDPSDVVESKRKKDSSKRWQPCLWAAVFV